jgi:hypothetical protein
MVGQVTDHTIETCLALANTAAAFPLGFAVGEFIRQTPVIALEVAKMGMAPNSVGLFGAGLAMGVLTLLEVAMLNRMGGQANEGNAE